MFGIKGNPQLPTLSYWAEIRKRLALDNDLWSRQATIMWVLLAAAGAKPNLLSSDTRNMEMAQDTAVIPSLQNVPCATLPVSWGKLFYPQEGLSSISCFVITLRSHRSSKVIIACRGSSPPGWPCSRCRGPPALASWPGWPLRQSPELRYIVVWFDFDNFFFVFFSWVYWCIKYECLAFLASL